MLTNCLIFTIAFISFLNDSIIRAENSKVIKLAWDLKVTDGNASKFMPQKIESSKLMEKWTSRQKVARGKFFEIGTSEIVYESKNKGLFATILDAYNNHWILKTSPEDWWFTISQKVAMTIDENAEEPEVRRFFVSHEGKKELIVEVGPSIYGVDYDWFFKSMTAEIEKNINNPDYLKIMDLDFSTSTPLKKTVNNIMLMFSFQKYFEYTSGLACGIPGVIMTGVEEDWKQLIDKLNKLEAFLYPIERILRLEDWFHSSRKVLEKLLETFRGNPDKNWWSRIVTRHSYGSGPTDYDGWLMNDFYGFPYRGTLDEIPSGVNVVPLTIKNLADESIKDEAAVVAGLTGYKITEATRDQKYPIVENVHGWGLLLRSDSPFKDN